MTPAFKPLDDRRRVRRSGENPRDASPLPRPSAPLRSPRVRTRRSSRPGLRVVSGDRPLHSVPAAPAPSGAAKVLAVLQLGSSWVAGLLVLTSLGSYGYSVHVDRQLQQTTSRLHRLQRSEQQLTTVNEVLKNHIAQQAEGPSVDLQPPRPDRVIFLKPGPGISPPDPPAVVQPFLPAKPEAPLGY